MSQKFDTSTFLFERILISMVNGTTFDQGLPNGTDDFFNEFLLLPIANISIFPRSL